MRSEAGEARAGLCCADVRILAYSSSIETGTLPSGFSTTDAWSTTLMLLKIAPAPRAELGCWATLRLSLPSRWSADSPAVQGVRAADSLFTFSGC